MIIDLFLLIITHEFFIVPTYVMIRPWYVYSFICILPCVFVCISLNKQNEGSMLSKFIVLSQNTFMNVESASVEHKYEADIDNEIFLVSFE